jgi:signal transduction histidine kinase
MQQEIRTASYLLHPPLLDERGLTSALGWYTTGLKERTGLNISLKVPEDFGRVQRDIELVIFRLVQECLTNIHRHSCSKTASIRLSREENTVVLEVRDAGKGIPPEKLSDVQSGGSGEMIVESDSTGTRVRVTIPISKSIVAGEARLGESLQAAI